MEHEKRLIDANALTDVVEHIDWYHISLQGTLAKGANSQLHTPLYKADDIYKAIGNAPTVDAVEVVHGRWEPHPRHPGFDRCSICHDCIVADDWADGIKWRYCPQCGAKMDGDEDGTD